MQVERDIRRNGQTLAQRLGFVEDGLALSAESAQELNDLLDLAVLQGGRLYRAAVQFSRTIALEQGKRMISGEPGTSPEDLAVFRRRLDAELRHDNDFRLGLRVHEEAEGPYTFSALHLTARLGLDLGDGHEKES